MTFIEQITEDIAHIKTRRASCRNVRIRDLWNAEITRLKRLQNAELKALVNAIRQHPDLAKRLDLIESVDGVGLSTAVAILVRMPEIGRVTREEVAALAGLAPYDNDSCSQIGARHIKGGRKRLRGRLYSAALPAPIRIALRPMRHMATAALLLDFLQVGGFVSIAGGDGLGGVARCFRKPDRIRRLLCLPVPGNLIECIGQSVGGLGERGVIGSIADRR